MHAAKSSQLMSVRARTAHAATSALSPVRLSKHDYPSRPVRRPDGSLSDMVNLTRAKDAVALLRERQRHAEGPIRSYLE